MTKGNPFDAMRFKHLTTQVFNMLRQPRPHYEFFEDRERREPWFAMVLFPPYEDWDAYKLCRVLRVFLLDCAATAMRHGDDRFKRLVDGMVTMVDIALETEPVEGEMYDGKLRGE